MELIETSISPAESQELLESFRPLAKAGSLFAILHIRGYEDSIEISELLQHIGSFCARRLFDVIGHTGAYQVITGIGNPNESPVRRVRGFPVERNLPSTPKSFGYNAPTVSEYVLTGINQTLGGSFSTNVGHLTGRGFGFLRQTHSLHADGYRNPRVLGIYVLRENRWVKHHFSEPEAHTPDIKITGRPGDCFLVDQRRADHGRGWYLGDLVPPKSRWLNRVLGDRIMTFDQTLVSTSKVMDVTTLAEQLHEITARDIEAGKYKGRSI